MVGKLALVASALVAMLVPGAVGAAASPAPRDESPPIPTCRPRWVFDRSIGECVRIDYLGGTVTIRTEAACPLPSLDGLDEIMMEPLLQCIIPMALVWADESYHGAMTPPNGFVLVPLGFEKPEGGLGCQLDQRSLKYCRSDGIVYFGVEAIWNEYRQNGSATVAGIVAHELAHRFQHVRGFPQLTEGDHVPVENQADCAAGVFLGWVAAAGRLDADAVAAIERSLVHAAAEDSTGTHGTADQRVAAFRAGFGSTSGLFACNPYYPTVPLIERRRR